MSFGIQKTGLTNFTTNFVSSFDSSSTENDDESIFTNNSSSTENNHESIFTNNSSESSYDCPYCDEELTPYEEDKVNGVKTHTHNEEADEENKAKNQSDFFYSDYEQHTDLMNQEKNNICVADSDGIDNVTEIINTFKTTTTSPEITDEEAENGVVNKETIQYSTPGLLYSIVDSHMDVFTYEDGSELTNYYDEGTSLNRQKEITYSDGCDPANPSDGDTQTILYRIYNDDGSYTERESTQTYNSQLGGWTTNMVYQYFNHRAYDADGNQLEQGSDEYKQVIAEAEILPVGTTWE